VKSSFLFKKKSVLLKTQRFCDAFYNRTPAKSRCPEKTCILSARNTNLFCPVRDDLSHHDAPKLRGPSLINVPPRLPHHFQTVSAGSPTWAFARPGALPNGSASGPDFLSPARDVTYKFPGMGATVVPRNKRYAAICITL